MRRSTVKQRIVPFGIYIMPFFALLNQANNLLIQLNKLKTKQGAMTSETKKGLDIMLDELEKTSKAQAEIKEAQVAQGERLTAVENGLFEVLKVVNTINDKLTNTNMEEKAAVMTALQKIVGTKAGKAFIGFLFLFSGLAFAYMIEHGLFNWISKLFA